MIQLGDKVVGSIWVDLKPTIELPAPAVHIMIGDPSARGQGVGSASTNAVISYLEGQGEKAVYTRCLTNNSTAIKLLEEQGFQTLGDKYIDENGLEWQNSKCDLNR